MNYKKIIPFLVLFLVLSAIILSVFYWLLKPEKKLPVYNPVDVNPRLVDYSLFHKSKNHRIGVFSLIDQKGDTISEQTFSGKIYLTDFFFTSCPSICPLMTQNMKSVQEAFKTDPTVLLLSHSVTPEMDSVPVLAAYGKKWGVLPKKWYLTTGPKKHIYNLARKMYFAALDEGDGGVQDFIHTEQLVLIDPKKRIRGFYDGTKREEVEKIIEDIITLKKEFEMY